ncbi:MAG: S41 family peptidase, partial [Bdellovibrionales bacterium]|nr:S41 family peptidase [Bdellovibrionales bacterium]
AHQVSAKEHTLVDRYPYLKTFTDVLALVEKNYVEPVDVQELVEGAIKGMLLTLDPHTGYLDTEIYKELQVETKGQFGGLGIEITVKDGLLTVVAPIEDSPAARAGILSGDQIIKIGDEFSKDMSLIDAVKKMRGLKGTPITIHVQREGYTELLPVTVVRDVIRVKSVRSRPLEPGFGYIRLAQFQEGSADEFMKALDSLKESAPENLLRGLVIDLRNNPGGLLTQAIRVSDLFLKEGVIVYTEGRLESQRQKYYAHDDGGEPDFPIIVLVNEGSASASEIVSGALQDHGRALILGQQTFGKGSVQTILPMEDGDALRLTTALYFTKSGRSIQAQGITPDITVSAKRFPRDSEELLEEDEKPEPTPGQPIKERDLPGALKNPSTQQEEQQQQSKTPTPESAEESLRIGSRSAMEADLPTLLKEDPQLDEALRLLKTWHVFKGKPTVEAKQPSGEAGSGAPA